MRYRPSAVVFTVLLIAAAVYIIGTSQALPERVASHFDAAGHANAYMTRNFYRIFMLSFGVGFPLLLVVLMSRLPRLAPNLVNLPNRDYWLAPERRATTFAALDGYALSLGCLLTLLLGSVHGLIIRANAVYPPRLENTPFLALLAAFIVAMLLWIVLLLRRFRKPSSP